MGSFAGPTDGCGLPNWFALYRHCRYSAHTDRCFRRSSRHHAAAARRRRRRTLRMATLRNLKIKTSMCKRIVKELRSYEKEVEKEAAKTADMKEKGADPYDLKQQENVLAESRMMVPDCHKRLETALADLKATLAELKEANEQGPEIGEAESTIAEVEAVVKPTEE
ncbi:unnamed protein product [Urochloa humidicola]